MAANRVVGVVSVYKTGTLAPQFDTAQNCFFLLFEIVPSLCYVSVKKYGSNTVQEIRLPGSELKESWNLIL